MQWHHVSQVSDFVGFGINLKSTWLPVPPGCSYAVEFCKGRHEVQCVLRGAAVCRATAFAPGSSAQPDRIMCPVRSFCWRGRLLGHVTRASLGSGENDSPGSPPGAVEGNFQPSALHWPRLVLRLSPGLGQEAAPFFSRSEFVTHQSLRKKQVSCCLRAECAKGLSSEGEVRLG